MKNKYISQLASSITFLREITNQEDFSMVLDLISQASKKGKLDELLSTVDSNFEVIMDLVTSFENAYEDVCLDPGEIF